MIPTKDLIIKNVSDSCFSRPVVWSRVPYHEIDEACVTHNISKLYADSCVSLPKDTLNCAGNAKMGTSFLLADHSFQQSLTDILLPCTPLQSVLPMSRVSICSYNSSNHPTRCDCSWQTAKRADVLSACLEFSENLCNAAFYCNWLSGRCNPVNFDFDWNYNKICDEDKTGMVVSVTVIALAIILVPVGVWLWVGYRENLSQERQRERRRPRRMIVCI